MTARARPAPGGVLALVHHHPGRVRLRSPALAGDSPRAARATEALRALPEVQAVSHDPETGSLLIEYRPGGADPDSLVHRAAAASGLAAQVDAPCAPAAPHGARFVMVCRRFNEAVHEITGFRVEPRTLLPAALAGASLGLLAFGRGPRLPRWDSLAYWSVTLFAMLHGREIEEGGSLHARRSRPARAPAREARSQGAHRPKPRKPAKRSPR